MKKVNAFIPEDLTGRAQKMCKKFWTLSFAWYQKIESELRIPFYFADPHSPWQKGSNGNTNGLLRESFPKENNFSTVTQCDLFRKGIYRINNRPGKVPGWKTAQECFAEELRNSA